MNEDLNRIYKWLCFNKLSLNIVKTKAMVITQKKKLDREKQVLIDNRVTEFVAEYKYLGVTIDENLAKVSSYENNRP
jgi:DNA-binding transcriptional regulator YhcF (GntR family)